MRLNPIILETREPAENQVNMYFASKLVKLNTRAYSYNLIHSKPYTAPVCMQAAEEVSGYVAMLLERENPGYRFYREVTGQKQLFKEHLPIAYSFDWVIYDPVSMESIFVEHKVFMGERLPIDRNYNPMHSEFSLNILFERTMAQLYLYSILARENETFVLWDTKKEINLPVRRRQYRSILTLGNDVVTSELCIEQGVDGKFMSILQDQLNALEDQKNRKWDNHRTHRDEYIQTIREERPFTTIKSICHI